MQPRSFAGAVAPVSPVATPAVIPDVPREQRRKGFPVFAVIGIVLALAVLGAGGWYAWRQLNQKTVFVVVPYPTDTPAPASPTPVQSNVDGTATAQFLALSLTAPTTAATNTSAPTATPVPATNTTAPTATRPAATATSAPPTAARPRPTVTPVPPTSVPAPTATTAPKGPATVAVVSVRTDPAEPHRKQQLTFYVTFRNTFTTPQQLRWAVYIFEEDRRNPIGTTNANLVELPVGNSEWPTSSTWGVSGNGDQVTYSARVVSVASDGGYTVVPDLQGSVDGFTLVIKP